MTSHAESSTVDPSQQSHYTFPSIDTLLSQYAKSLKPGESISIPLYKGSGTITTIDPLQATKAHKAAAAIGAKEPAQSVIKRHEVSFPKLCKFIETVERPDFHKPGELQDGRLYMEDIPKAKVRAFEYKLHLLNIKILESFRCSLFVFLHHLLTYLLTG
jgi:hypothetical protein